MYVLTTCGCWICNSLVGVEVYPVFRRERFNVFYKVVKLLLKIGSKF